MKLFEHVILPALAAAAVTAVFCLGGCSSKKEPGPPPNVILITWDTVRTDHVSCYGYPVRTTPNMDTFAKEATRYTRVVASSPWTVPTHASFFTGKYPFEHGAHAFDLKWGGRKRSDDINNVNPLPAAQRTLAEVFWDEGYTTAAFVANDAYLSQHWQLNQGFELYHVNRVYAPILNDHVFQWLDIAVEKSFFLFINYIDAHRPYNVTPCPGLVPRPVDQNPWVLIDSLYNVVMPGTEPAPEDLRQKVIDQYDTAIWNLDAAFGDLVAKLKKLGLYENTIIILTSDHGEFLGEHLLAEHSKDVYEETMSIPMVVKYAHQKRGKVVDDIISATDIPYLILSQFGGEQWEKHLAGFPDKPGEHEIIGELYYTRTKDLFHPVWGHRFNRVRTVIYDWPFKYISSSDGDNELYNLENDRVEAVNLVESDAETAKRLAARLQEFITSRVRSDELVDQEPLSEEEIKRLKSLGYVGD